MKMRYVKGFLGSFTEIKTGKVIGKALIAKDVDVIFTAAIKVMHSDVEKTLNAISIGFFGGGNVTLQADTGSTGYVSTEGRNQLSAGTIEKLDAAYESIILGDIVPAANFNGITPENFTWK